MVNFRCQIFLALGSQIFGQTLFLVSLFRVIWDVINIQMGRQIKDFFPNVGGPHPVKVPIKSKSLTPSQVKRQLLLNALI